MAPLDSASGAPQPEVSCRSRVLRRLPLMLGLAATLVASQYGTPSAASVAIRGRSACGVERWTVKTLQDRPRLLSVRRVTLAYLVSRPAPSPLPATRLPFERHVFRVTAAVRLERSEDDGDFHLVLSDGKRTMIAESPSVVCTKRATLIRRRQMARARAAIHVCAKASITGVAFFDFKHGQTGVAPNAIELHPILAFACGSQPPAPPSPPTATTPPPTTPPRTTTTTSPAANCAPSYPTVCIPPPPPDLNCADIPYRNFPVRYDVPDPDPHHFDGDHDGIGCEG